MSYVDFQDSVFSNGSGQVEHAFRSIQLQSITHYFHRDRPVRPLLSRGVSRGGLDESLKGTCGTHASTSPLERGDV